MSFGKKHLYICKKKIETNENGYEIPSYENPIEYYFNYMCISSQTDYQIYGTKCDSMLSMYIPYDMLGKIKVGDVAYMIDNETLNIDDLIIKDMGDKYKSNANYRVYKVLPQLKKIRILFEKIGVD